jgi:hypothetical protein
MDDVFLEKKSSVSINAEKNNNIPNYVERFKGIDVKTIMRNDFKMIAFKQLTIFIKTQNDITKSKLHVA